MSNKIVQTSSAPSAIGPYSQAVWAGDLLYTSGQVALHPETGEMCNENLAQETHQVMKNLTMVLQAAGLSWNQVIKTTIYIMDMNAFSEINEIYASYLSAPFPARETVQVARLPKDAKIEISVVAQK